MKTIKNSIIWQWVTIILLLCLLGCCEKPKETVDLEAKSWITRSDIYPYNKVRVINADDIDSNIIFTMLLTHC